MNAIHEALNWLKALGHDAFKRKTVRSLLILIGLVITSAGLLLSMVDPGIHSPLAGMWYALVTLAHVGYGDIVATSGIGRVISGLLIVLGIGLIALAAGIFASILVVQDLRSLRSEDEETLDHEHVTPESRILIELQQLNARIAVLESELKGRPRSTSKK